ncbi:hypothetical protein Ait01nite_000140 [Actinoplanes italicus]|uniref:Uncharacterized protein n=1 Tax=Actinoplanes italicus TaxID=113567 RepID=A0A2T0KDC4_9ACTN|nr:hypothetical protein [Actinoplanes italicus]PRX21291.1 hypothetical protein CLV67_10665 [Actinoplanes italicus]GIE26969.1 hypothetical protein Ait01nite_000140 [Actinoplanes italicus]
MKFSDDQLRSALRSEAATHRPDRDAMLDRITTAAMQDTGHRRRGPRVRVAAAVAAVVVVFGGGGVGTWALAGGDDREEAAPAPTAAPVTTAPSPVNTDPVSLTPTTPATTKPTPARTTPSSRPTTAKPSPTPTRGRPGNTRVEQGPLWSDGSVDPDSGDTQGASIVTLKTTAELTSLEVVIRVARTDGLASRGGTKQTPGASVTTRVDEEPGAYLYRFTLSSADTLAPGTYTFTAKYTYPSGGRDAGGDTYEATAGPLNVYGNFY